MKDLKYHIGYVNSFACFKRNNNNANKKKKKKNPNWDYN